MEKFTKRGGFRSKWLTGVAALVTALPLLSSLLLTLSRFNFGVPCRHASTHDLILCDGRIFAYVPPRVA